MTTDKDTMAISKFKATCLAVLKRVKRTGRPVVITRFGEPIAEVVPPTALERQDGWLGAFDSRGRIVGDIIAPAAGEQEWEVLRE